MATIKGPTEHEIDAQAAEFVAVVSRAVKATLSAVADQMHGSVDDLAPIQKMWKDKIDAKLLQHVDNAFDAGAVLTRANQYATLISIVQRKAITADGAPSSPVKQPFKIPLVENPQANEMLANAKNRLVGVGDHVWHAAREQLIEGTQNGEGIRELRQRVRNSAQFSDYRAQLVARSEVSHAMNQGSLTQMRQLGLPTISKTWLAIDDGRTRPEHLEVNNEKVPLDGTFSIGEDPGDAPNCRCTIGYDLPEDDQAVMDDSTGEALSTEDSFIQEGCGCVDPILTDVESDGELLSPGVCVPPAAAAITHLIDYAHGKEVQKQAQIVAEKWARRPSRASESWWMYQQSGPYREINGYLRGEDGYVNSSSAKRLAEGIKTAFAKGGIETEEPILLYRGVISQGGKDWNSIFTSGKTFTEDGVMSTTASEGGAHGWLVDYADYNTVPKGSVVLELRIPTGTRILGGNTNTIETMLPPGTSFKIVSRSQKIRYDSLGNPQGTFMQIVAEVIK